MQVYHHFQGKTYLILGLAKSGYAAARLLHSMGARVIVNDAKSLQDDTHANTLRASGINVIDGGHPPDLLEQPFAAVVKNPGIRYDNSIVSEALARHIPVITEVELAGLICEAPFIAITGSNGKTTTTTLIGEMLREEGRAPIVAGNIGRVVCEEAARATADNIMVTELSSFQLLGTETFHPRVAVLLNIFDTHLDYHGSRENYMQAKAQIFTNQTPDDLAVVNADDADVTRLSEQSKAEKILFSTQQRLEAGVDIRNGAVCFHGEKIMDTKDIALPGTFNLENILAAIAAVKVYHVSQDTIAGVLKRFHGVKHRLQYVETIAGRPFFNNSKATNILATEKALTAFSQPVILLAGGLDRGNTFDSLVPALQKVKVVVVFGETAEKVADAARKAGCKHVLYVNGVSEAVPRAYNMSEAGDVILLSPACASWDQHATFEERGDMFIEAVHKLR